MPTWSSRYGGPMRDDQVESLVRFVMNWEEPALAEAPEPTPSGITAVGTDITVALPEGDPDNGAQLVESLGCTGCHVLSATGPTWQAEGDLPAMGARGDVRIGQADYTGNAQTAEQYLIESIVLTNVFVVEGFQPNIMPGNYGERLSAQDLADMIAYLLTLR